MNVILQNLYKSYGNNDILSDFSLDIVAGMRLAICGPNGCGKSTLIRIIAGIDAPDAGKVLFAKGCRIGYVEQSLDEGTLEKNLLEWVLDVLPDWHNFWLDWDEAHRINDAQKIKQLIEKQHDIEAKYGYNPEQKAQEVLSGLGFSEDKWQKSMKELSGGWRERAKLARVLVAGADVLLLDEPTNHLDMDAVEWLEAFLLAYKGVLIFVAHDRYFMDKIGTHVLYLGASKPLFRKTSYTKFLLIQEEIEEQKLRESKRISEELDRKMDFVRRFGAKASKARQANSKLKMAQKLSKELEDYKPEKRNRELSFAFPQAAKCEKLVLSVADIAFSFDDGTTVWKPLTFSLFRGQKIALVGHNGSGKSTLLKILAGALEKKSGSLAFASQAKLGYFSQHQHDTFNKDNNVLGEIRRLADPHTTEEELMSVLGLFMLGHNYFERLIKSLSGGEKTRLALALLFLSRANILVMDEPTNHLDIESRQALVAALDSYDGTLLLVAHDRYLLSEVADEVWEMSSQGIEMFELGFEEYYAERKARITVKGALESIQKEEEPSANLSREEMKKVKREQAEERNRIYKELKPLQEKYAKKEQDFEKTISRQQEIEAILSDSEVFADSAKTTELLKEFHQIEKEVENTMEELALLEENINKLEKRRSELTLE